jgi:hypothetical protein
VLNADEFVARFPHGRAPAAPRLCIRARQTRTATDLILKPFLFTPPDDNIRCRNKIITEFTGPCVDRARDYSCDLRVVHTLYHSQLYALLQLA